MTDWSIYLVRCGDGSLYTGIATDVDRRFEEHAEARGAKYLRGRGPLALVLQRSVGALGDALRLERRVKRLPKATKEAFVANHRLFDAFLTTASSDASGPS